MAVGAVNSIQSNITGSTIARILTENSFLLQKSLIRLSTGLRVVSAGDDPAQIGTAIKFNNRIARIGSAQTTIENAKSLSESQSGFLDKVADALDRMSELAVLAKDGTISTAERSGYQTEFADLQGYVSDVASKNFNSVSLFGTSTLNVVIDEEGKTFALQTLNYTSSGATGGLATAYGSGITLNSTGAATTAQTEVETAISNLGLMQAKAGSHITRLELEAGGLTTYSENLQKAEDNIMAVDIASESSELARLELLTQSGIQTMTQWNNLRTNLLKLFQ